MPKRTNSFQQVVTIVHAQLAGDATTEESAELTDRVTGDKREVDAVIRSEVAGYEMVLGIEATQTKATLPWVEQQIAKHQNLPTNRLVLVSERGASVKAFRKAASEGVPLIVPELLTNADPSYRVVNKLESVWPKGIALTPERVDFVVTRGGKRESFSAPTDMEIYLADGRFIGTPSTIFRDMWDNKFPLLAEKIGLADIAEDRDEYFVMRISPPDSSWTNPAYADPPLPLCLKWLENKALHRIEQIEFNGRAVVRVAEVKLTHRRFKDRSVAYGEADIGEQSALVVMSEDESGGIGTLSLRDKPQAQRHDGEGDIAREVKTKATTRVVTT